MYFVCMCHMAIGAYKAIYIFSFLIISERKEENLGSLIKHFYLIRYIGLCYSLNILINYCTFNYCTYNTETIAVYISIQQFFPI